MPESVTETAETPVDETPVETEAPKQEETKDVKNLPEWAQEYVKELRDEAAANRVKAKNSADEAKAAVENDFAAKIAEKDQEIASVRAEASSAKLEIIKLKAALEAGVPGEHAADLADRIRGENEEEIKGDAKRLKELLNFGGQPYVDPAQGRGTSDALALNGDPLLNAMKSRLGF